MILDGLDLNFICLCLFVCRVHVYASCDQALRSEIDAVNEWVYLDINNGVYKCGFAQSQAAYDDAFNALFASLDKLESLLSQRRYVAGDQMTEADVRAFATLVRFDEVSLKKCDVLH